MATGGRGSCLPHNTTGIPQAVPQVPDRSDSLALCKRGRFREIRLPAAKTEPMRNPTTPPTMPAGKTKFDHRKKSGRRKDVEPNNQPNDGSDRACRSRSKYCPPYGLRLGA